MSWAPKRFWAAVAVEPCEGGFTIRLDGRAVKTPAKAPLVVPARALAERIATEWDAQEGPLRPETMPATRTANSAIDKVRPKFAEVAEMLAEYGGSDLLCYRAGGPEALVARQKAGWDPLLIWARQRFGAPLAVTEGVMHIPQPPASLAALRTAVFGCDEFRLAALHDLVAITGSLILGLAVAEGRIGAGEAFDLSRIDERWQIEQWGEDAQATATEAAKCRALHEAAQFHGLCG
ncbi:MAG: ATPase [Gemmobacter sp.]|jgi:chaperone required for assembly of F1-ATPase|nr:ATPase [Gemmobacter sp.]